MSTTKPRREPSFAYLDKLTRGQRKAFAVRSLTKLITRGLSEAPTPEVNLIVAIIGQAFDDSIEPAQDEARRFFTDGRLDYLCELIGVHPDAVCDMAQKLAALIPAQFVAKPLAHHQKGVRSSPAIVVSSG